MPTRWEYLIVMYEHVAKMKGEGWDYEYTNYIWRRGDTEAEVRTAENWLDLCNELGDEGWELVESSVLASTIVAQAYGYNEVSHPLRIRHSFKRPVDEGVRR